MMSILLPKRNSCSMMLPIFARFFSSAANKNPHPNTSNFMADYLVSTLGFSPNRAFKISKSKGFLHVKSAEKPDAVLRLLKNQGFTDVEVKKLITWQPIILCSSPENSLEPNLYALSEMGFSSSALRKIILSGPTVLRLRSNCTVPRIKFWMDFFAGDEVTLVTAFTKNRGLVGSDIGRGISPKISLLQSHGLSTDQIQRIVLKAPGFIVSTIRLMEDKLTRAKKLGFHPGSGMFVLGLHTVATNTREALQKKMELFKSLGWSQDDYLSALQKAPTAFVQSEKCLQAKMDFLIGEASCDPSYIASVPIILACSLQKRLRPRHHVLHLLELNNKLNKKPSFSSAIFMTDDKFVERYILPYKDAFSGLHEDYLAACA